MTKEYLPAPVEGASDIAKFLTGVSAVALGALFPEFGAALAMGAVAIGITVDSYAKRPQEILLSQLQSGDLTVLTDEQKAAFIPMAFRFFEAARQGEYAHTLEVLAAFIKGELKQEIPNPGAVASIARRIEGLSHLDLQVISCIEQLRPSDTPHPSVLISSCIFSNTEVRMLYAKNFTITDGREFIAVINSLTELTCRNLLKYRLHVLIGGDKEDYETTRHFDELIKNARETIDLVAAHP